MFLKVCEKSPKYLKREIDRKWRDGEKMYLLF